MCKLKFKEVASFLHQADTVSKTKQPTTGQSLPPLPHVVYTKRVLSLNIHSRLYAVLE